MYPRNLKRKCWSKCGKKFSNCFSNFVDVFSLIKKDILWIQWKSTKRVVTHYFFKLKIKWQHRWKPLSGSSYLRKPPVWFWHFKIYVMGVCLGTGLSQVSVWSHFFKLKNLWSPDPVVYTEPFLNWVAFRVHTLHIPQC
jgi:hypothetical protein